MDFSLRGSLFLLGKCEIKNILGIDFYEKCVKLKVEYNKIERQKYGENNSS